jgi:hypothetical protein
MLTFKHSIGCRGVELRFSDKPEAAIRAMLKANGFRWAPSSGTWWRRGVHGAADFLAALDRKLHPGRPDGACWECQAPEGFFRPRGATTPVYCDACHAKHVEAERVDRFDRDYEDRCRAACGL